ncbi:MAG: Fic family protein [Chitinophagaceae bacterium]
MAKYIHELADWPSFTWDDAMLSAPLAALRYDQGRLIGRMENLGFDLKREAMLQTLTQDVVKSSEIEGEILDNNQVRSSIARRLGLEIAGSVNSERHVDGVVEMMVDATQRYEAPLTDMRLFGWHAALFPTGFSGMYKITVGTWRTAEAGPMQVVSGAMGKEHVHYEAPEAARLSADMTTFLAWVNDNNKIDPVVKAAIAHLWFVTIHPFDDGNGRIARAIADMQLARADGSPYRFYSMSSQIRTKRKEYYEILEKTQKGSLDITPWIVWFLHCLSEAIASSDTVLKSVLAKSRFWESQRDHALNARQRSMLNRLIDGFEGKLTSSKWAKITKSSQDTAGRDIQDLIEKGLLVKDEGGGRSTSYSLTPQHS